MNLKTTQEKLFHFVIGKTPTAEDCGFIVETKGISRAERLETYKRSSFRGLVNSIEEDFDVTMKMLKSENSEAFIRDYLKQFPSQTHYINEVTRDFPDYITKNRPEGAPEFITELAKMEWLMVESFYDFFNHKTHNVPMAPANETAIKVNTSLKLFESDWPLAKIWYNEKSFEKQKSYLSLWTLEDRVIKVESWSENEFLVLKALQKSQTLEQAIAKLDFIEDTVTLTKIFSQQLPHWVQRGLLDIELSSTC